jgi:hypothetical protein
VLQVSKGAAAIERNGIDGKELSRGREPGQTGSKQRVAGEQGEKPESA